MVSVITNEITYKNFGKCVEITNGTVHAIITVDVGPRIINYSFVDGENIMFEDIGRALTKDVSEFDVFDGKTWYIYGGHRLWTSPEALPRSYYPDNDPVAWETVPCGIILTPPEQKWNNLAYKITVTMEPDTGALTIKHEIKNTAAFASEFAPWALSVLSQNGFEVVPQPQKDTQLLSNRVLALWPYTRLTDERVYWGDKYITLKQDPNNNQAFKFGINSEHGFAMYFNHGDMFLKRFDLKENAVYPDGGMSFETYTSNLFLEMESIGELRSVAPGETVSHSEYWSLAKEECPGNDEVKIDELVKKYVK